MLPFFKLTILFLLKEAFLELQLQCNELTCFLIQPSCFESGSNSFLNETFRFFCKQLLIINQNIDIKSKLVLTKDLLFLNLLPKTKKQLKISLFLIN